MQNLEMKTALSNKSFDRPKRVGTTLISGTMRACMKRGKRGGKVASGRKAKRQKRRRSGVSSGDESEIISSSDSDSASENSFSDSNNDDSGNHSRGRDRNRGDGPYPTRSTRSGSTSTAALNSPRNRSKGNRGEKGYRGEEDDDNLNPNPFHRMSQECPPVLKIDSRVGFLKGGRIRRRKGKDVLERALLLTRTTSLDKWRISLLSTIMVLHPPGIFITTMQIHFEICRHFFEGHPHTAQTLRLVGQGPNKKEARVFRPSDLLSNLSVIFALRNFICSPSLMERLSEENSSLIQGNVIKDDMLHFISILQNKELISNYSSEKVHMCLLSVRIIHSIVCTPVLFFLSLAFLFLFLGLHFSIFFYLSSLNTIPPFIFFISSLVIYSIFSFIRSIYLYQYFYFFFSFLQIFRSIYLPAFYCVLFSFYLFSHLFSFHFIPSSLLFYSV